MKTIQLNQGKQVLVDDEDYEVVSKIYWTYDPKKMGNGYACARINEKKVYLHRILMNAKGHEHIDHRNNDGLDCRRENLRKCSNAENSRNRRMVECKSGFKGVFPVNKVYRAKLTHNYEQVYLGTYKTKHEAAEAYDLGALERFGEFARPNLACSRILHKAIQLEKQL